MRIKRARETEIAAAGAAHLVSHTEPPSMLADLAVLSRDDVCTDSNPKVLQTAAVIRDRLDERARCVPPRSLRLIPDLNR